MIWERHGEFDTLVMGEDVVGNVFPFRNGFAAAMQGDYMKTCRTRERGRAYVERRAETHHKELCLQDHMADPQTPRDLWDLNAREDKANPYRAAIAKPRIPF